MLTLSTIFVAFYLILIRIFRTGWRSVEPFRMDGVGESEEVPTLSVVIACRNEEEALPGLLAALRAQTFANFELIVVDDHSTDRTRDVLLSGLKSFPNALYVAASGRGKKSAIAEGVVRSSGDWVVTTDADCRPVRKWLETVACFLTRHPSHLLIGPVRLSEGKSFFSHLQQFEFVSLVAAGAGAAGAQFPILCNAANMAFRRDAWLVSRPDLKPDEPSGDDVFLLQSIKNRGGIIRFLRSDDAMVETTPAAGVRAFVRQRRRWAGKSTAYTDWQTIAVACIVFGVSLMQLALLAGACFDVMYLYFFLFFFLLKYAADTRFLSEVSGFFRLRQVPFYSLCLSLVYPFYIVFTALSALLWKPKKW